MRLTGKAWKFGDNVDTDAIIPARYLNRSTAEELAVHCMEDLDPAFAKTVQQGDIIVAGENFGCGSSREHAPMAIKGSGISCVIAASFARIFYRNAINVGLPVIQADTTGIKEGDELTVDLEKGLLRDKSRGLDLTIQPYPEIIVRILDEGGLVPYMRKMGSFSL